MTPHFSAPDDPRAQAQARELSRQLLDHAYQRHCGLALVEQSPGWCRCRLRVTEAIDNLSHTLHGGVIYSMLDVTSMLATLPLLGHNEYALTNSFQALLQSATGLGEEVTFEARVTRAGRNLVFTQAEAWKAGTTGQDRVLVASAQLAKFRLKRDWS